MASNTTFGAVLREAREHRGMDVQSIARQMRVRADIIRAIENNDFTRMPPRGYAKNMVATYARIVGVNQTTITRMYLEAANAYETGKMKNDSSRVPNMRSQRSSRGSSSRQADDSPRRSSGRLMFDDRRDARGAARGNDHVHTSRRPLSPGSPQYTNLYAAPQNVTQQRPKLPLLIGIGVIGLIVSISIQPWTSQWMDVVSIYICPLGAALAGIMFFWVLSKKSALEEVNNGAKKPIGSWFYPLGKYIYIPLSLAALVLGIIYGGIG